MSWPRPRPGTVGQITPERLDDKGDGGDCVDTKGSVRHT